MSDYIKFDLLSIDAWRDPDGGWQWNAWYTVEKGLVFAHDRITPRCILAALRRWDFLTEESKGKLYIEDDGYNIQILLRNTHEPIFALAYGEYEHEELAL